jgi:hypothetical protein
MESDKPSSLSDAQLIAEVARLARSERGVTVELIAHLAELEDRQLHLRAGYSKLFPYCTEVLRLSEHEAYNRIEAARAARKFPRILEMLVEGALTLTTVRLLAPRLTGENCGRLLAAASGRSKRDVEELLARHAPRPDVPVSIRKVPAQGLMPSPLAASPSPDVSLEGPAVTVPAVPPATRHRPVVMPLAPDRYQFTFTASAETREMLDLAKDMLRHAVPDGDTGEIMRRALKALLDDFARKKFAATDRPRKSRGTAKDGRPVSAEVKRAVWIRDRGRCAFVGHTGRRCNERSWTEFHHVVAYARGGKATVENIQLRCRAHNAYEADLEFGERRPGGEWAVNEALACYEAGSGPRSGTSRPLLPGTRTPLLPGTVTDRADTRLEAG